MIDSGEFLSDILQGHESKIATITENETILTEQANLLRKEYDNRKEEIDQIIRELCDERVQEIYERIGSMITTQRKIWNILINSKFSDKENNDCSFNQRTINELIFEELKNIETNYTENFEYINKIEDDWKNVKKASFDGIKLAKEIDWENIPEEELGRRLRGGEVLHRDEWIPNQDKSSGRKLNNNELKSHMDFGEIIMKEGKQAFEDNNLELSYTRYTQGVELLSWVRGTEPKSEELRLDMYKRFLKNQALLALKLGKYNDSILSCNKVLQIDECDEKSLYRRGECYMMLGRFEEAKKDFRYICEFDYFSKDAKIQSRKKLVEMMKKSKTSNKMSKNIIDNMNGLMFENRNQNSCSNPNQNKTSNSRINYAFNQNEEIAKNFNENYVPKTEIKPYFDLGTTIEILEELLFTYTSQEFEEKLYELRKLSDYDEKRFIRRLRKILPEINIPIFQKFGLNTENCSYEKIKKTVEDSVSYWRSKNDQVSKLSKEIYKYIMGDTLID